MLLEGWGLARLCGLAAEASPQHPGDSLFQVCVSDPWHWLVPCPWLKGPEPSPCSLQLVWGVSLVQSQKRPLEPGSSESAHAHVMSRKPGVGRRPGQKWMFSAQERRAQESDQALERRRKKVIWTEEEEEQSSIYLPSSLGCPACLPWPTTCLPSLLAKSHLSDARSLKIVS